MAFLGIVSALSKPARQALPLLRSGVRSGIGADRLFQTFRTRFPGLTRASVRIIARAEREIMASRAQLKFVNRDKFPDVRRLPPALTKIRRRFSFRVELRGIDSLTGDLVNRFVTVTTDDLLTRGEIEDVAEQFAQQDKERYPIEFINVLLTEGVKAGPEGVLG